MNETINILANETDLAARAAVDPAAFAALYDHYFPKVYNFIRYRVRDVDVTDEITSLVFERILTRIATYRPERAPLGAWVFAIARHAVEDHFRAQRRRQWFSLDHLAGHPAPEPLPEEAAAQADTSQRLLAAIGRLPAREQDILALKFASGLENVEIARLTGLNPSHVGVILYRALRQLRSLLDDQENHHE